MFVVARLLRKRGRNGAARSPECDKTRSPECGNPRRDEVQTQRRDKDASERATGQCCRIVGRLNMRSAEDCGHRNNNADCDSHSSAVTGFCGLIGQIRSPPGAEHIVGRCWSERRGCGRQTSKNRPICLSTLKHLKSSRLAGFLPYIWSNLCTRHIRNKLGVARASDWPDIRGCRKVPHPADPVPPGILSPNPGPIE